MNVPAVAAALRALIAALEAEPAAAGVLTVAEVAARLHRSPSTVRGWCEQGRFSGAFKLNGRDWRVPIAALDGFLDGQRSQTSPDVAPGATISTQGDTLVHPRRARQADLGAWRRERDDAA